MNSNIKLLHLVWLGLLTLTLGAYLLIEQTVGLPPLLSFVIASSIAGAKVMLIFHYFVELQHAPTRFTLMIYAWVFVVTCVVMFMPWLVYAMALQGWLVEIPA